MPRRHQFFQQSYRSGIVTKWRNMKLPDSVSRMMRLFAQILSILMKKGFRDAIGKAGADGRLFSFAQMACQMRDREEAKRLYALIDEVPEAKRPKNTTTDACRMVANGADPKGI